MGRSCAALERQQVSACGLFLSHCLRHRRRLGCTRRGCHGRGRCGRNRATLRSRAAALRDERAAITIGDAAPPPRPLNHGRITRCAHRPRRADFDALQEDSARWIGVAATLGNRYSRAPAVPAGAGAVLVALPGREFVFKLYPPFLRDHFEFERAMRAHLQGRLSAHRPACAPAGAAAILPSRSEAGGMPAGHGDLHFQNCCPMIGNTRAAVVQVAASDVGSCRNLTFDRSWRQCPLGSEAGLHRRLDQ